MNPNFRLIVNAASNSAELHIEGVIGDGWFGDVGKREVTTALADLPEGTDTINVFVNSPGGDVFDGIGIHNALKNHGATINTFVRGIAASAASLIVMAGDRIVMEDAAMLMIHNASGVTFGQASDHTEMSLRLEKIDGVLAGIYARRTETPKEAVVEMMNGEKWFDGEEAVAAGFADETTETEGVEQIAAHWPAQIFRAYSSTPARIAAMLEPKPKTKDVKPPSGANNQGKEDKDMTETNVDTIAPPAPVAASIEELEAIAPDAPGFVLAQFKAKATKEQAQQARIDTLTAKMGEQAKTIADSAKALKDSASASGLGVDDPLDDDTGDKNPAISAEYGTAEEMWNALVLAKTSKGMPGPQARAEVNMENPGLKDGLIDEANPN